MTEAIRRFARMALGAALFGGLWLHHRAIRRERILVVGCHASEFSNNALAVCLFGAARPGWHIVAACHGRQTTRLRALRLPHVMIGSVLCSTYFRLADYFACTGYMRGDFRRDPSNRRAIRLLLWHGMPIKGVGLQCSPEPDDVSGHDYAIATSALTAQIMSCAFGLPEERIIVSGEPRTDFAGSSAQTGQVAGATDDLRTLLGSCEKLIVYAPTWREEYSEPTGSQEGNPPSAAKMNAVLDDILSNTELVDFLIANRIRFLVKLHPFHADLKRPPSEPFVFADDQAPPVERLIGMADLVVTDYSSVIIDALASAAAVRLYVPDHEEYVRARSCPYFDFEDTFEGISCTTVGQLIEAIEETLCPSAASVRIRDGLRELFHCHSGGSATARLLHSLETMKLTRLSTAAEHPSFWYAQPSTERRALDASR